MAHYEKDLLNFNDLIQDAHTWDEGMVGYLVLKRQYVGKVKELCHAVSGRELRSRLETLYLTGRLVATLDFSGQAQDLGAMEVWYVVGRHCGSFDVFEAPDPGFTKFNRISQAEMDIPALKVSGKKNIARLQALAEELEQVGINDWGQRTWFKSLMGYDPVELLGFVKDLIKHGQCRFEQFVMDVLTSKGVKCAAGLIKGFATWIKETLAIAKRKAAQRISMAELTFMQRLPLEIKIAKSLQRIREWYEYWEGNVHVTVSGGKDSTVLLHLVRSLYPHVPAVYIDCSLY